MRERHRSLNWVGAALATFLLLLHGLTGLGLVIIPFPMVAVLISTVSILILPGLLAASIMFSGRDLSAAQRLPVSFALSIG